MPDTDKDGTRRKYLRRLAATGLLGGVAGCQSLDDDAGPAETPTDAESPDSTPTDTPDQTPTATPEEDTNQNEPEETASPVIEAINAEATANSGELRYGIDVSGGDGIVEMVEIETGVDKEKFTPTESRVEADNSLSAKSGEINEIVVTARTESGGEETATVSQYARQYNQFDQLKSLEFEVAPHYLLFWDGGRTKTFDRCGVGAPAVGPYSQHPNQFDRKAIERHFDQMQGHGISKVVINFGESDDERETLQRYIDEIHLLSEMTLEFSFPIIQAFRRDRDISKDFDIMTSIFKKHERIGAVDGRPVVYLWAFSGLYWESEIRETIENEYGGLPELVAEIHKALSIDDVRPFLIPDVTGIPQGVQEGWEPPDQLREAIEACDGISHWFHGSLNEQGQVDPTKFKRNTKTMMQAHQEFAAKNDLEYLPVVYPGFDDRENQCWGEDRHVSRSVSFLTNTLEMAAEYGTVDTVHIATWNDWAEGTMIEPGTYRDDEFGTSYLEAIQDTLETQN